ncbi:hypothetical protein STEG23_002112 [Scotinomys teguina]
MFAAKQILTCQTLPVLSVSFALGYNQNTTAFSAKRSRLFLTYTGHRKQFPTLQWRLSLLLKIGIERYKIETLIEEDFALQDRTSLQSS